MARYLGDINTRARGLRTHLLPASDLERLARATSLFVLQRELSGLGYARSDAPATAMSLEKEIRRHAAGQITMTKIDVRFKPSCAVRSRAPRPRRAWRASCRRGACPKEPC